MPVRFRNSLALCLALLATPAVAQTSDPTGALVYPGSFFALFSPSNALEIVERVPGFVLEEVDEEIRGFAQAAGNVVINGQRPSSKSETIDVILARIPANRVLRIEVASGERYGSEYSTKAQVLNLVLTDSGGLAGTVEAAARRDFTGRVLPEGSASALLKRGKSSYNLSASVTNGQTSEEGFDRITVLPGGALREFRDKLNRIKEPALSISGSWAFDDGAARTAHLNGQYARRWFRLDQTNNVFPVAGASRNDSLVQRYNRREYEIGGDVTRPFAGGGLKLIGLLTRRQRSNLDVQTLRSGGLGLGGSEQLLEDRRDETLARLVWDRSNVGGWNIELGAEGVLNKLDSDVGLFSVAGSGLRTRIDLPIDQAVVKEKRAELFVNAGRPLTSKLRLDLGLTYETSKLTVRGDVRADRSLNFLKPKATLDWRPKSVWHVQLSVSRTVAQLQFEDFISSATLASEQVSGGNANLEPQRAWEILATIDRPILGDGLIKVELGHNRISKVQDRVPTPEGFDAPGNLGSGRQWIATAKIDAPLTRFGLKGGRLTLYGSYSDTSVTDPYTLRSRPFTDFSAFSYEVEFRQDLDKFAWGIEVEGNTDSAAYRRTELDRFVQLSPRADVFVEYRPSARTTFSLTLRNILQNTFARKRTFYAPDRTSPDPNLFEYRQRRQHVIPHLKIKHSFG